MSTAAIPTPANPARDPFALELIKNALAALADEMALTISRTARSFVVKEALDFSTALFLADGELMAQGTCLPFHLGAMPFAVASVRQTYGERIRPGDLFITNDPYDGSTHLPDIVLVRPIFRAGALVGFASALAHMTDIGGRSPGGNASDSTELYQEGLRIPPSRLWREGEPDETMLRLIERNVRVPDKVLGDIRSLISACLLGEREFLKLVDDMAPPSSAFAPISSTTRNVSPVRRSRSCRTANGVSSTTSTMTGSTRSPSASS